MERGWRSPRSSMRYVSVHAAELCRRVSLLFWLLRSVAQAICVPCLIQPRTVKIVFPDWAMPSPPVGTPGFAPPRAAPAGGADPEFVPVLAEAGNKAAPPGAPGALSLGEVPPFEAPPDFPGAEAELAFPPAKIPDTMLAHEELFEELAVLVVAPVDADLAVAAAAGLVAAVALTLFAGTVSRGDATVGTAADFMAAG